MYNWLIDIFQIENQYQFLLHETQLLYSRQGFRFHVLVFTRSSENKHIKSVLMTSF